VNRNRPHAVKAIGPKELKALLDAGTVKHVYDVRTPGEREKASIAGTRLLDDAAAAEIEELDKSTPLAFFCHHGPRSANAAEHFLQKGWKQVYNLTGGIDAWSLQVDPTVPRY
jgi:monothiol glutaredoxin